MKKKDQIKQLTRERDHARALACNYEAQLATYHEVIEAMHRPKPFDAKPFDEETFLRRARIVMDGQ